MQSYINSKLNALTNPYECAVINTTNDTLKTQHRKTQKGLAKYLLFEYLEENTIHDIEFFIMDLALRFPYETHLVMHEN